MADRYIKTNYSKIGMFELIDMNLKIFQRMDADSIGLVNKIIHEHGSYLANEAQLDIIERILNKVEYIIMAHSDTCKFQNIMKNYHRLKVLDITDIEVTGSIEWLN